MAGAVVAGKRAGGHSGFRSAQRAMAGLKAKTFTPDRAGHRVYQEIYALYSQLHDAFGTGEWSGRLHNVMKDLLAIRTEAGK
jgi:L-ribulokinase